MSNANWKPFIFGGLASVTAECGELDKGTVMDPVLGSETHLIETHIVVFQAHSRLT